MVPVSNFPRTDMNASSNAQDILERRRRQIERTKAANLSKQLQMRLQYARLKVEHGWQKQTLNEVENLYFHYYRGVALSGDLPSISSPKKDLSRQKPNVDLPADAGSTESSVKDLPQMLMDIDLSTATVPKSLPPVTKVAPGGPNVDNSESISDIPQPEQNSEPVALPVSESYSSFILSTRLSKNVSHPSCSSPASPSNISLTSHPDWLMHSNPLPNLSENLASPAAQTPKSAESTLDPSKILLSPSLPLTSSSTATIAARSKGKSTFARTPSKLPIPRLPTLSYPYAIATSSGKTRKAASTVVASGAPESAISPLPSPPTAPLLSPYKPSHPVGPSAAATLQGAPSAAAISGNGTPLPLTYDSFWSSHASSSSLPASYRTNVNTNLPSTSTLSLTPLPAVTSTHPGPSTMSAPTTSISTTSPNFPFTSSLAPSLKTNSSPIPSLSHSPIIASLLHSQGLPLFPQTRHSPAPVTSQNAQAG